LPRLTLNFLSAIAAVALCGASALRAQTASQTTLPDAPSALLAAAPPQVASLDLSRFPTSLTSDSISLLDPSEASFSSSQEITDPHSPQYPCPAHPGVEVDKNCKPIPLERQQPHRILGFMPNFRTVSAGAVVHPPGWKYNFTVATHQALDYSTFIFLGLTTLTAEGLNEHPSLGKGVDGFYAYGWRGFLDKTDGTYLSAWLLPSIFHEDTRYYPLGAGHPIVERSLYIISREAVARTYSGRNTPSIAGLGGKVLTQVISRTYYPTSSEGFGVLAEKFGYSVMRDVAFSSVREFYPDLAAHYIRKHRAKVAAQSARDAAAAQPAPASHAPH
jgi:hypothetical protein